MKINNCLDAVMEVMYKNKNQKLTFKKIQENLVEKGIDSSMSEMCIYYLIDDKKINIITANNNINPSGFQIMHMYQISIHGLQFYENSSFIKSYRKKKLIDIKNKAWTLAIILNALATLYLMWLNLHVPLCSKSNCLIP